MAQLTPSEKPYSHQVRRSFGFNAHLGNNRIGKFALGLENPEAGVYRVDNLGGHQKTIRNPFYMQWKPRTANQNTTAQKFANGMTAWKGLTEEEKEVYNERAKKYRITGANLFMREYMLTH